MIIIIIKIKDKPRFHIDRTQKSQNMMGLSIKAEKESELNNGSETELHHRVISTCLDC